jgi:hypothetical protein
MHCSNRRLGPKTGQDSLPIGRSNFWGATVSGPKQHQWVGACALAAASQPQDGQQEAMQMLLRVGMLSVCFCCPPVLFVKVNSSPGERLGADTSPVAACMLWRVLMSARRGPDKTELHEGAAAAMHVSTCQACAANHSNSRIRSACALAAQQPESQGPVCRARRWLTTCFCPPFTPSALPLSIIMCRPRPGPRLQQHAIQQRRPPPAYVQQAQHLPTSGSVHQHLCICQRWLGRSEPGA